MRYFNDVNLGTTQATTAYSAAVTPVGPTPPGPNPPGPTPAPPIPTPAPPNPTPAAHDLAPVAFGAPASAEGVPVAASSLRRGETKELAATGAALSPTMLATLGLSLLLVGSFAVAVTSRRRESPDSERSVGS